MPPGRFKLHSLVTNRDLGTFTKDDLGHGVQLAFSGSQTVEILEVSSVR
jgi:hypothetical protein